MSGEFDVIDIKYFNIFVHIYMNDMCHCKEKNVIYDGRKASFHDYKMHETSSVYLMRI